IPTGLIHGGSAHGRENSGNMGARRKQATRRRRETACATPDRLLAGGCFPEELRWVVSPEQGGGGSDDFPGIRGVAGNDFGNHQIATVPESGLVWLHIVTRHTHAVDSRAHRIGEAGGQAPLESAEDRGEDRSSDEEGAEPGDETKRRSVEHAPE